jgi:hypothetical protein
MSRQFRAGQTVRLMRSLLRNRGRWRVQGGPPASGRRRRDAIPHQERAPPHQRVVKESDLRGNEPATAACDTGRDCRDYALYTNMLSLRRLGGITPLFFNTST